MEKKIAYVVFLISACLNSFAHFTSSRTTVLIPGRDFPAGDQPVLDHDRFAPTLRYLVALPPEMQIVVLSTMACFLVFVFFSMVHLSGSRWKGSLIPLSMLIGGISSEILGYGLGAYLATSTVYLPDDVDRPFLPTPTELILLISVVWLGGILIRRGRQLFAAQAYKRSPWILPKLQSRMVLVNLMALLSYATMLGIFFYAFLLVALGWATSLKAYPREALFLFPVLFVLLNIAFLSVYAIAAIYYSHKIAGPIFAFDRAVRDLLAGKKKGFRLRDQDEFKKELEALYALIDSNNSSKLGG